MRHFGAYTRYWDQDVREDRSKRTLSTRYIEVVVKGH